MLVLSEYVNAQDHTLKFENSFSYSQELTNMIGDYENYSTKISYTNKLLFLDVGYENIVFHDAARIIELNSNLEFSTKGHQYDLGFIQFSLGLNFKIIDYLSFQSGISFSYLINKSFKINPNINLQTGLIDGVQFDPNEIQVINVNSQNLKSNINDFRGAIFQRLVFSYELFKKVSVSAQIEYVNPFTNLIRDPFALPNYFDNNKVRDNDLLKFGFGIGYLF